MLEYRWTAEYEDIEHKGQPAKKLTGVVNTTVKTDDKELTSRLNSLIHDYVQEKEKV